MQIVRTDPYLRSTKRLFSDAELDQIDELIAERPDAGAVIADTGGIRKIRVPRKGMGKRGGARVIYYWHQHGSAVYLLAGYAKAAKDDLSADEKKALRRLVEEMIDG